MVIEMLFKILLSYYIKGIYMYYMKMGIGAKSLY